MNKIRSELSFMLFAIFLLVGCSTTANFYPIEGPLSEHQPVPVIKAKADGIMGNSGNISLTLPNGEFCEGHWSVIAPSSFTYSTASAQGNVTSGMASVWSTVYGSGFSVGNMPGVNKGEAVLVGDQGTVIQCEFYTGSGTAHGSGVAKDNKGNIFKMLF